jgi:hypothetical protein
MEQLDSAHQGAAESLMKPVFSRDGQSTGYPAALGAGGEIRSRSAPPRQALPYPDQGRLRRPRADRRGGSAAGRRPQGIPHVGAVDVDPAKAGRDLGETAEVGRPLKVAVRVDVRRTIRKGEAGRRGALQQLIAPGTVSQLETSLKMKVPVVSTTEELS